MLPNTLFALVVSPEGNNCFEQLKSVLKKQQIEPYSAKSCEELARLLDQTRPELIFTAKLLCDGTWRDVIHMSEGVPVPTSVIVVGEDNDVRFYILAMDYGAFDFIVPPFEDDAIAHVVRVAADSVRRRRESHAKSAAA